jgi:heme exporter protein D
MAEYATFKAMGHKNFYLLCAVFEEAIILSMQLLQWIEHVIRSLKIFRILAQPYRNRRRRFEV